MRRVSRPDRAPAVLQSEGFRAARSQLLDYMRRPLAERGQRRAPINEDAFYDPALTEELRAVFAGKCAYCETPVPSSPARHHRPLRFAAPTLSVNGDDYYAWLAYEWRNMLVVCDWCEKAKGGAFPVEGGRCNYLARYDDVRVQEQAVLLDPCVDDPRRHLQFLVDGSCVHRTERGAVTIVTLDLNRSQLVEGRREAIAKWFGELDPPRGIGEYRGFGRTFAASDPHAGASLDVLRRVMVAWRGVSSGDVADRTTFLRNVERELNVADFGLRDALELAVRNVRRTDESHGDMMRDATARAGTSVPVLVPSEPLLPRPKAFDREIRRISITGFKALDRLEIGMPPGRSGAAGVPCLVILGENSTGKSTLLSAIALALIGREQARRLRIGASRILSSDGPDRPDQLDAAPARVEIGFHAFGETAWFGLDPESERVDGQSAPLSVVLGYGPRRYSSGRHRKRSRGAHQRVRSLFDPVSIIPYPDDWLAGLTGERFETVASALRIVLALNDEDQLVSDPEKGMCVLANGRETPIEWLSEGYRSIFAMIVDILREMLDHYSRLEEAQGVVLIDEIETHLHPRWKMQIMTSLRRALPRVQFIVTTHDPLCLRGMDDTEVVVLQRVDGHRIRRLEGLPSVKGMSAEQLLTSDYFGLSSTADPTLDLALARLTSDVVRTDVLGRTVVEVARPTEELVATLSLGRTETEAIVQTALQRYLATREFERDSLRTDAREDAVEAVRRALAAPDAG